MQERLLQEWLQQLVSPVRLDGARAPDPGSLTVTGACWVPPVKRGLGEREPEGVCISLTRSCQVLSTFCWKYFFSLKTHKNSFCDIDACGIL